MIENQDKVIAGMVLYNSDFGRLEQCLKSLSQQVEEVIVYDNSPEKMSEEVDRIRKNYNIKYIHSPKNLGMPEAMNEIMKIGQCDGAEWILTMNPDSIVPAGMIAEYRRYFSDETIGMICPQVIDKRRKYMVADPCRKNAFVSMCITSAACTRVKAWQQVGGFDGWLFVDLLDNDISKRMILNGWKIFQVNSIILDQEFGEIRPKSKSVEQFWVKVGKLFHNDNFAKFSYKKIVHPNRIYYTCRNILYLNKKFVNYGGIGYKENYNCNTFAGFLVCFVLPSILRAEKKKEVIKAVIKGFKDGREESVEPWVADKINK